MKSMYIQCGHCDDPAYPRRRQLYGECGNCGGTGLVEITESELERDAHLKDRLLDRTDPRIRLLDSSQEDYR